MDTLAAFMARGNARMSLALLSKEISWAGAFTHENDAWSSDDAVKNILSLIYTYAASSEPALAGAHSHQH
jgi:hypothetical protein